MTRSVIEDVLAWQAFDSRGTPTVGCVVRLESGVEGRAIVPAGASTGSHEAAELRDGGPTYLGRGVQRAVGNVRDVLRSTVVGLDVADRAYVDEALQAADPDDSFARFGANAILAVSLAATLAWAQDRGEPLWRALGGPTPLLPMPMVNIVSGGAHAGRLIDIQDVLVVPSGATTFAQAMEWTWRVRHSAAQLIEERGASSALVADEGGLAAHFDSNETALSLVVDAIDRAGLVPGTQVSLALDLAANQLWDGEHYRLDCEDARLTPLEWLDRVRRWCARYPIWSVEDVLIEDDWAGWADAGLPLDCQVLGDDLFATNAARLQRGIDDGIANAVLIKPNQAGTVTRAERVLELACDAGYATVVSARSGDTEDHWVADLAVGWAAGQIKVGSLTRSERTSKWNRILEIESTCGERARFTTADLLAERRDTPPNRASADHMLLDYPTLGG